MNYPDNFDSAAFDRHYPPTVKDLTPYEETLESIKEGITKAFKSNPPWARQGKSLQVFLSYVEECYDECFCK